MRAVTTCMVVFAGFGLLGPLLRLATWPPAIGSPFQDFVYELILLVWPTQPLALMEASIGSFAATTVAVAANAILFSVVGAVAGLAAKRQVNVWVLHVVTCVAIVVLSLWITGSNIRSLDVYVLVVACLLFALPFLAVSRFARRG
jgi:hypothetical protein